MKAVFLDRDGVLNVERSYICDPADIEIFDFVPEAIRRINMSEYLAVVVSNQSAVARRLCTIDEVEAVNAMLRTELARQNARLDAFYYCPHYFDGDSYDIDSEFNIDCDCRKPKTGMFLKAAIKFDLDLSQSFMIGDSEKDILAGKNAGCITIGVRTGYALKNSKIKPDYMFENLLEAVKAIIS